MIRWLLLAGGLTFAETVNNTYDDAGRLIRVSYGSGTVISYKYDPAGNLLSREVSGPDANGTGSRATASKKKKNVTVKSSENTAGGAQSSKGASR